MKFYFHPLADKEFEQAVQYYEECQPGLGLQFSLEVYASIRRVMHFPKMFSRLSFNGYRQLHGRTIDIKKATSFPFASASGNAVTFKCILQSGFTGGAFINIYDNI
jgi:hypothetical protein